MKQEPNVTFKVILCLLTYFWPMSVASYVHIHCKLI